LKAFLPNRFTPARRLIALVKEADAASLL